MSTPAQTPEGVQDQPAPEVTPEPAAPAPSGPWAKDLERFVDPAVRAEVDSFLRETIQPYNTQLEQKIAELAPAQQLYADLVENPADTYVALTEELFGEDGAKAIQDQLTNLFGEEEPAVTEPTTPPPAIDPEDKQAIEWAKQEATKQAYNAEFDRVKSAHEDVPAEDWNLFHPFVASTEGNFDAAAERFTQWRAEVAARYAPATPDPAPDPAAPPTLGTEAAQTVPPVQKNYTNIDEAIEDWFAEERPAAPPVVGSI